MRGYPQFSFWISITLVEICFSRIFSKPRENTFEFVGTVLKVAAHLFVFARKVYLKMRAFVAVLGQDCKLIEKHSFLIHPSVNSRKLDKL